MDTLINLLSIAALVIGFGFVVFWHELGHFVAAKAVGIKVEQFAVGFGQALLCWRKGIGVTVGSSAERFGKTVYEEWERRNADQLRLKEKLQPSAAEVAAISRDLALGETEYRLNWIPLGGYVKMLGQDDLDPAVQVTDPRAYNNKPIPARMLVVSAGVLMNILLAAVLFMGLFLYGFKVTPPLVGGVQAGSPAQKAGLQVGDRIVRVDGNSAHDFNKVSLNVVLLQQGATVPVDVLRDGKDVTLQLSPERPPGSGPGFLAIGIEPVRALRGIPESIKLDPGIDNRLAGSVVTAVNGTPIPPELPGKDASTPSSYALFDKALQSSAGQPVTLSARNIATGNTFNIEVKPRFAARFDRAGIDFAGILVRPSVSSIAPDSSAAGKLQAGDRLVALQFDDNKDVIRLASIDTVRDAILRAGRSGRSFTLTVERGPDRTPVTLPGLTANIRLPDGARGLGIGMDYDPASLTVASAADKSSAARAGFQPGDRLLAVNDQPVSNLFQFRDALLAAGQQPARVTVATESGDTAVRTLSLSDADRTDLAGLRAASGLVLAERIEPRQTANPLTALKWGVEETRDLILQGYITIKRMFQGSVPASGLTGPVGILHAGGTIATTKSTDWLIWFLAMISANLAVVNFLPIPIVDGGLFVFLILEKLMGRPLSPRTQGVVQIVGMALILSVFLFVTYNDIVRLF